MNERCQACRSFGFGYLVIFTRCGRFQFSPPPPPICARGRQHPTLKGKRYEYEQFFKHFSLSSSHPNLFPGAGLGLSQDMEQGSLPRAQFLDKAKQNFQDGRGMNDNACIHSTQTNPGKTVPRPSRGAH